MNPLTIFSGPYALLARLGIVAAVLIAAFIGGWIKGNNHGTAKLTDYIGKQAVETVRIGEAREKVVVKTEIEYRDRIKKVYVKGDTIEKEVTKYVTQTDDSACIVPVGFVREYAAAWGNVPPGPPGDSDREPSGVQLSAVAGSIDQNATICHSYKVQRDGLIEFYRNLQKVR